MCQLIGNRRAQAGLDVVVCGESLTANRGLCGGYNANLIRAAEGFIRKNRGDKEIELSLVGRAQTLLNRPRIFASDSAISDDVTDP